MSTLNWKSIVENIFQNNWFYNSNLSQFLWFFQKSCRKIVWKWVIVACFIIRKACFCSCAFNMTSLNVFWKPFVPNRCKMCQFRVIFCHFVNKYKNQKGFCAPDTVNPFVCIGFFRVSQIIFCQTEQSFNHYVKLKAVTKGYQT